MKQLIKLAQAGLAIVFIGGAGLISLSQAGASGGPGQIVGGNQNYLISDITKGTSFANTQTAAACDILEYRLRLYNPGPSTLNSVKVEASINTMTAYTSANSTATVYTPDGQTKEVAFQATVNLPTAQTQSYVQGSTQLLDSAGHVLKSSSGGSLADTITMGAGGIDLGSLGDSTTDYLKFRTQLSCPTPPPPTPTYSCNKLNLSADSDRTVKLTVFNTTATNGASFKNATIDWGDSSTPLTTTDVVGQIHKYDKDSTYTITATAHFVVGGKEVSSSGSQCQKLVTFSSTTPPTVTPPPSTPGTPGITTSTPVGTSDVGGNTSAPTQLVNTGTGSVASIFMVTSVVAALGYRLFMSRRLSNQ